MDLPRPRADHARTPPGRHPGPLDRPDRPAYRLYRPRPAAARKLDRDARILAEELKDRPDEPFVLFNLGAIAIERRDWTAALGYLRQSLSASAPSDSITRKLYALIARAHQMMGETAAALRTCAEGLSLDPEDAELLVPQGGRPPTAGRVGRGRAELASDRGPEASRAVRQPRHGDLRPPDPCATWPCWPQNDSDPTEAARLWHDVLAECPGDREALAMLDRLSQDRKDPDPMPTHPKAFASIEQ